MSPRVTKQHIDPSEGLSAVLTLATGLASVDAIRIETWQGKEYTVVPVVAIVEGVLQGANAKVPEFAAAAEFGKFPKAWDGRPVVMNHPQINGVFVSAGMPIVLEEFGMGMVFNTKVDDKKLKCEAWLDHGLIEERGGEALETLERIRGGEVVEVSVGAWLDVANKIGTYNGKSYQGVWQNVAPDHLAFLSKGTTGACSVADGCGVPRLFSVNAANIGQPASCCDNCTEGKPCSEVSSAQGAALAEGISQAMDLGTLQRVAGDIEALSHTVESSQALFELLQEGTTEESFEGWEGNLTVNEVPEDMAFSDIKVLVFQGLLELLNMPAYDIDLCAITTNAVVYYQWGRAGLHMRTYSVTSEGAITFSGDEVPVNLLTRIVPRQTTEPSINTNSNQETTMTGTSTGAAAAGTPPVADTNVSGTGDGPGQVLAVEQIKPPTFEEMLAAAPASVRESIESGVRMFESRRNELVAGLVACETCSFTEEELKAFSNEQLEKMAKMSNVANFSGRAVHDDQLGVNVDTQQSPLKVATATQDYLSVKAG